MTAIEERITFCRICEACCGMVATVEDGRVTKLKADKQNPFSEGYICPKGPAYLQVHNDPDRVLHPLSRQPDGSFAPVSWDAALDDIAARLRVLLDSEGPESVGFYAGNQIAFNYAAFFWVSGFMAAIQSPHFYAASSIDINNRWAASAMLYGNPLTNPIPDLERSDFLFLVGTNPFVSHGSMWTVPRIRERLLALQKRGGRVVVVDPRRTETAEALEHLPIRPDGDAWPTRVPWWIRRPASKSSGSSWPPSRPRSPRPAPGLRPSRSASWPATPRRPSPPPSSAVAAPPSAATPPSSSTCSTP
jgi:anaerobic selenocysteine-containing dehydrogenase